MHILLQNSSTLKGINSPVVVIISVIYLYIFNLSNVGAKAPRYPGLVPRTGPNSNLLTPILCICYTNHVSFRILS